MDRVLLALDRARNRALVAEWLDGIYDVFLPVSDEDLQRPFDLGIIDGPALDRLWQPVLERRLREQPVILPFLLITPRPDVRLITRHIWRTIDELILSPVEKLELHIRAEILLRGRRLSLALRDEVEAAEYERRRAEAALESRARLIRGVTHDLKNPLGAIRGFADMLLGDVPGELAPDQRNWVRRILRATTGTLRLLDDLLELLRAESGRLRVESEPVDVERLLRDVADEHRGAAESERLALSVEIDPELGTVEMDPHRVRQILGNLLSNALKYTPEGGRIRIHAARADGPGLPYPGPAVAVSVSDTGPGIPREAHELIFQEFSRLDTAVEPRGVGLGLAISRTVARLLGGDLTVDSSRGRGATFTFWLPMRRRVRAERRRTAEPGGDGREHRRRTSALRTEPGFGPRRNAAPSRADDRRSGARRAG